MCIEYNSNTAIHACAAIPLLDLLDRQPKATHSVMSGLIYRTWYVEEKYALMRPQTFLEPVMEHIEGDKYYMLHPAPNLTLKEIGKAIDYCISIDYICVDNIDIPKKNRIHFIRPKRYWLTDTFIKDFKF